MPASRALPPMQHAGQQRHARARRGDCLWCWRRGRARRDYRPRRAAVRGADHRHPPDRSRGGHHPGQLAHRDDRVDAIRAAEVLKALLPWLGLAAAGHPANPGHKPAGPGGCANRTLQRGVLAQVADYARPGITPSQHREQRAGHQAVRLGTRTAVIPTRGVRQESMTTLAAQPSKPGRVKVTCYSTIMVIDLGKRRRRSRTRCPHADPTIVAGLLRPCWAAAGRAGVVPLGDAPNCLDG